MAGAVVDIDVDSVIDGLVCVWRLDDLDDGADGVVAGRVGEPAEFFCGCFVLAADVEEGDVPTPRPPPRL
jgi:hypothetical protein